VSGPSRALVTGGSGFLGRHLVPQLEQRYDLVDCIDLSPPDRPPSGTSTVGDVRDVLPATDRYDAVFHLAALVGGRAALEAGPLGIASNLALDVAFFEYVARTRPAAAAYLSSSAVYPAEPCGPDSRHAEADVQAHADVLGRPDSTYGWVKLTGEHLAQVVRERYGVPVLCYRPFTVYGPHQPTDYPVSAIAARALAREDPLTLWGSGRQVRDLVYVEDAVAAIVASHDRPVTGGALNICTGVGTSFMALARTVAELVGYRPDIVGDLGKPAGVDHRVGAPDLLHRWAATPTDPAHGLDRLLSWLAPV